MRRTTSQGIRRLLSSVPSKHISQTPCIIKASHQCLRPFSHTANIAAKDDLANLFQNLQDKRGNNVSASREYNPLDASKVDYSGEFNSEAPVSFESLMETEHSKEPHHFHIYATKHNTHITVTTPERNPIISVGCGNIGFRHAGRKHYDSAFQLAGYVMGQLQERAITPQIKKLEVVLRGFGAGREAVTKALLGSEGRYLRDKIVKVADATRLKFGGTRSKKPRRLG